MKYIVFLFLFVSCAQTTKVGRFPANKTKPLHKVKSSDDLKKYLKTTDLPEKTQEVIVSYYQSHRLFNGGSIKNYVIPLAKQLKGDHQHRAFQKYIRALKPLPPNHIMSSNYLKLILSLDKMQARAFEAVVPSIKGRNFNLIISSFITDTSSPTEILAIDSIFSNNNSFKVISDDVYMAAYNGLENKQQLLVFKYILSRDYVAKNKGQLRRVYESAFKAIDFIEKGDTEMRDALIGLLKNKVYEEKIFNTLNQYKGNSQALKLIANINDELAELVIKEETEELFYNLGKNPEKGVVKNLASEITGKHLRSLGVDPTNSKLASFVSKKLARQLNTEYGSTSCMRRTYRSVKRYITRKFF